MMFLDIIMYVLGMIILLVFAAIGMVAVFKYQSGIGDIHEKD